MKHALNITTTLILCGSMAQAYAQSPAACIPTPSCTSLGYTSTTSCTDGLKCPFGNYWNCDLNKITELTNKITELEKTIETMEQESALKSCQIGHLFNSDKTCSVIPQSGKTPIGVVVYVDGFGHGQVMALKSIGSYAWGPYDTDISSLPNYDEEEEAVLDLDSCGNTAKIIAAGDKSTYPAAWAAHEYKTEGTSAGDWCLPAAGIMSSIYYHQQEVNMGLVYGNGTQFTERTTAWSSSEITFYNYAWFLSFSRSYGLYYTGKDRDYIEVRPVIEF